MLYRALLYSTIRTEVPVGGTQTGSYQTGSYQKGRFIPPKPKTVTLLMFAG